MTEISLFAILSAIMLFSFISIGVIKFGLQNSYSGYSIKWGNAVPLNNMNLWSIVTIVAAFLLCPVMLELAAGSLLQFLGFLTPVYLIIVSLTPNWYEGGKVFAIHTIFAILCMIGSLVWSIAIMHAVKVVAIIGIFYLTIALLTGTYKASAVFWIEMWLFVSTYLIVLMAIL